jgi:hypothetical protein
MRLIGSIRRLSRAFAWFLAFAGVLAITASATAAALFVVNEPWVRPAASAGSTDVYMVLRSSEATTLVAVRCELASGVTLEAPDSAHRGKFRDVTHLPLPAGETVRLAPGQVHGRLASVKHALKLGQRVALVLTLESADGTRQEIPVDAEVRHHSPTDDETRAHRHPTPRPTGQ